MRIRTLLIALAGFALVAAGCGGGATSDGDATDGATDAEVTEAAGTEAAGIDCQAVDVIVPYSPGGGSDQQVRRLQGALEEATGARLNITYQEGGDGSVGWNALAGAEPDGCTISNVVMPNISNLSLTAGEDLGFTAEDFEYIGFTEYSPNIIGVAKSSEFQTIEDFVTAAKEGSVSVAGVGSNGELLLNEVINATDAEYTYVPVSGGVGDIIPQVAGGHVDAAISGFSLLDGEQLMPIALSGTETHEDFPDVPTFEDAGFPGVNLVTSWGFILPPETPEGIVNAWNAALQEALQDEKVQEAYAETPYIVLEQDAAEARAYFEEQHEATAGALGE